MEVLQRMLSSGRSERVDLYSQRIQEIALEDDAELMCWRLAIEWSRHSGAPLPPALEPYRHRPDLARRHAERALPEVERRLVEWAERRRGSPSRALRVEVAIRASADGAPSVDYQALVTTARLRDAPRTTHQLHQLRNEVARRPTMMSPDQVALLDAVLHSVEAVVYGASSSGLLELLERAGTTSLVSWAEDCDSALAQRYGITPGGPVSLGHERVSIVPVCEYLDGSPGIDFRVEWPDGRTRSFDEVFFGRARTHGSRPEPGVVLADGKFYRTLEEPPSELLDHLGVLGRLPIPERGRQAFFGSLASAFPSLRETLGPHLLRHATVPAVALRLDDDDWLQVRAFAHTAGDDWKPGIAVESPAVLFEYGPEGRWEKVSAGGRSPEELERLDDPLSADAHAAASGAANGVSGEAPLPPEEVWLEEPDPERATPLIDWLARTGVKPGIRGPGGMQPAASDRGLGWWVRLGPRTIGAMAEAWAQRPRDTRWFGNPSVALLLGRARRVSPRVHVRASGVDWLEVSPEWSNEALSLSDAEIERLRSATAPWVKLRSGWMRRDAVEIADRTSEVLADLGVEPGAADQRITVWQLAQARPESLAELERLGADPEAIAAIRRMRGQIAEFRGLSQVPVPAGFRGELRPYQRHGLDFLVYTSALGLGVVLADDMGLGKTVQTLAWLVHLRETTRSPGPALVVCPTSVMGNWEREAARFAPDLRVLVLGRGAERHALRRELPRYDLVVTNYALLRRDLDAWKETELFALVLDEAQNVKNPDAVVTEAARAVRARHRLALTGTPLENRALDLWSIMSIVNPGYLGDRRRFALRFDRPDAPGHVRRLLAAKLRPVLLRRLKRDVAPDLPDRIEERRDCELTNGQKQLYLAELETARRAIQELAADPASLRRNRISILAQLTRLRQICCHPVLGGGKENLGSGKFDALFELLEPLLAEGHKVLVFSQFVRCLDLLEAEMARRRIAFHVLIGETVRRDQVVQAFHSDERACVFLISLRAGGTGLNLTAASYVVLFDPWWNPAVEAQAIDRTHRIGQDRTVIAYRLLARGTIEEKIWELQQRKAALVKDVLGEEGFARGLDREALEYLLAEK
ncbi:MAG TPA: DEAD/DEAH box helicase [Candidatus Limnocylindria bacterium]|nr:DEAD/DEAH box helicase [Candidatus Limnocylindria bacterium]